MVVVHVTCNKRVTFPSTVNNVDFCHIAWELHSLMAVSLLAVILVSGHLAVPVVLGCASVL